METQPDRKRRKYRNLLSRVKGKRNHPPGRLIGLWVAFENIFCGQRRFNKKGGKGWAGVVRNPKQDSTPGGPKRQTGNAGLEKESPKFKPPKATPGKATGPQGEFT